MADPITGAFLGWVCGKLGDGTLKHLAFNCELGRHLDKAIARWANGLPADRHLVPDSLYRAAEPSTPEERPAYHALQDELMRGLPSAQMWHTLFLESWRWVRDNSDGPQAFFTFGGEGCLEGVGKTRAGDLCRLRSA